jgi:N-acetylglucosaminyldiphosphoundecaprenol N-acetyl-beta-D-mannosaminyltransferase
VLFRFGQTRIDVTHADASALLSDVSARLTQGTGFALATINLDHLVKLGRDAGFRSAYAAQDFVVADGNPIVWLSRLAQRPVALVPGSDLVLPLVAAATRAGRPVAILGTTDAALAAARDRIAREVPGVQFGPLISPPLAFDPDSAAAEAMLAQIGAIGPCLCLLALGAPKQERLAALGREVAPQAGFASVGAGVDFLAGHQTRAPDWVRALALEWLWRAASQPRRLIPRYAACAAILPGQVVAAWRLRAEQVTCIR